MEKERFAHFRKRVSWASIFGGVMTVLAVSVLLGILGSSIGLFMFDPQSENPASGIGTTVGIWTVVSLLVSLGAGGFVAGKLAGQDGIIHGFLVWATSLIVALVLVIFLAVGAVKATFNALGSVTAVVGDVISGAGSAVKSGVSDLSDQVQDIFGDIEFETETGGDDVQRDIRTALRRSGVREFQPEFLRGQMKAVRSDLSKSVKRIARNPNNADEIISDFLDRLRTRGERITNNINKEDLVRALSNNSQLTPRQAEETIDEYIELTNNVVDEAKNQIASLEQSIEQARQDLIVMKQDALEKADKAANSAARSALFSFFGILIGAILCGYAGLFGAKKTREGYDI